MIEVTVTLTLRQARALHNALIFGTEAVELDDDADQDLVAVLGEVESAIGPHHNAGDTA